MPSELRAWLTGERIWSWAPGMETASKVFIGRREHGALIETVHVVARDGGWAVSLSKDWEGSAYNWVLSADGTQRKVDDPDVHLFLSQADAIVAAVCRLEFCRRMNHPALVDARRKQFDGTPDNLTNEVLNIDIWNDASMRLLDVLWSTR